MRLYHHGGKCCGIKIIEGFGINPTGNVDPNHDTNPVPDVRGMINSVTDGTLPCMGKEFFLDEAPRETYIQRLDRLINFAIKKRSGGLLEAVLATASCPCCNQVAVWGPILEERGFTPVTTFYNSNSGNKCTVYHKIVTSKTKPVPKTYEEVKKKAPVNKA
jgi:hypothetical protein